MTKIAIGADHAGFRLKAKLIEQLQSSGYEVIDFGTGDESSVDYPDYVHPLAEKMKENKEIRGILICGSANGVCMTANKHKHIRAALCWKTEIARLAREHNNANVLCLPARYLSESEAAEITETFLNTDFEGGRHQRRVEKICAN